MKLRGRTGKASFSCAAACSYRVKLTLKGKTLAAKKGKAKAGRTTSAKLRLSARQARKVSELGRRSKALKLTVTAAGAKRSTVVAPR